MNIEETALGGVFIIANFVSQDERGIFVKTFSKHNFHDQGLNFEIRESYFSVSQKDVIRGMHFQLPVHDHEKLVYVPKGAILDVILDLRKNSATYRKYISLELSADNKKSIFIPRGLAHGFKSLEKDTIAVYNVSTEYNPESDAGIHFNSFGFDWQSINPIVSKRDTDFETLEQFCNKNPF